MALKFFEEEKRKTKVDEAEKTLPPVKVDVAEVKIEQSSEERQVTCEKKVIELPERQKALVELLKTSECSLRKISLSSKVSRRTLYNLIEGTHIPARITIIKLCKYFGKNWQDYIEKKEEGA